MGFSTYRPVILVVEDDRIIRNVLYDLLTDERYDVILAADGSEAIKILSTIRPDLVTLDLNLPGASGSEVLETIRRSDGLKEVQVVILSAKRDISERVRNLAHGVIAKPYDTNELLSLVERLLGRDPSAPL